MSQRPLRVMVLDDEPIVGKRLKPALEKSGYEVETLEDGRLALARMEEAAFDVVVTDIRMEEVDGIEVLDHVLKRFPDTKVVLITGYATLEIAREAMLKGAFDFIAKPFTPDDLRQVIARAASGARR
jgi:DNA-binding NtrC family response regulator